MEEKYKILIVEDEKLVSTHVENYIEKLGYEVLGKCSSAKEALQTLETQSPDLLLVDIFLDGDMDGVDLVNQLKENGKEFVIIYLTSTSSEETLEKAKKSTPHGFVQKPFDIIQLKSTIEFAVYKFQVDKKAREKEEKRNRRNEQLLKELSETNSHLVTATLRERELKQKLQESSRIIEEQNKKILDSINYARRIQNAIIPRKNYLDTLFEDYFLYYKPKDVVSGDFPWIYKQDDFIYFAAVDCTGHGVPGAMMSLIGFLLLNNIANEKGVHKTPADILNELHASVVNTLKQDEEGNKAADGMDVALCRINTETNEVLYSGAHRPLYHVKGMEILQYKGDKFPIGGMQYKGSNSFTNSVVDISKNDSIYFFSDGFPDQFGGEENLKLGPKRIRDLIEQNIGNSMKDVEKAMDKLFVEWMGDKKQMDDVLMIGIKF